MLTAGGYLVYLNQIVSNNVRQDDLLPSPTAKVTNSTGGVTTVTAPPRSEAASAPLNMLILGTDSRDHANRGRSDVILLAHINGDRSAVTLIHFPRDLYVGIPGHGKNKINAAYAYGGVKLLVLTLQQLIHVPIDHVAIVDFNGFKQLTDAIGGVDVRVAEASPGFPAGVMHMDGKTGLKFVRTRYRLSQGDISRGRRQQAFVKAVLLKGLSKEVLLNPIKLASFIDAGTSNLTVDQSLDVATMRALAFSLRNVRGNDISFITAPWKGIGTSRGGISIVVPSKKQMAVLSRALRTDSLQDYDDPVSPTHGFSR